jgi:sugar phosphate permease
MLLHSGLIMCAAPSLLVFVYTRNLTAIVVAIVLYAAFQSTGDMNILPLLCDLASGDKFAIAFGTCNMVNCLAGGLGIFVAGILKSSMGLRGVFVGIIGFLVFDSLMLFCGYHWFLKKDLQKAALHAKAADMSSHG